MKEKLEWIVQTYLGMQPGDHQCVSWNQMQEKMVKEILELFDSRKISKLERVKPYFYAYQEVSLHSKGLYFQFFLIPSDPNNLEEDWYLFKMSNRPSDETEEQYSFQSLKHFEVDFKDPSFNNDPPIWVKIEMDRVNMERFRSFGMEIKEN